MNWRVAFFSFVVVVFFAFPVSAEDGQCVCEVSKFGKPFETTVLNKPKDDCAAFSDPVAEKEYDCSWVGGDPGGGPGSYGCWCEVKDLATGNQNTELAPFAYASCGDQSKNNKEYSGCHWEGEKPKTPCTERDDFCDLIGKDGCEEWCKEDGACVWEGDACKDKSSAGTASSTASSTDSGPSEPIVPSFAELNPITITTPQKLIGTAIKTIMGLIGSIALVMFVYGGVLWMTAMGNSEREKKGREVIVWSGLGVVVILISYIIVDFVFEAFK